MERLYRDRKLYYPYTFSSEREFERLIVDHQDDVFGQKRVYLDIKRKVGNSVPDGYLFDFSRRNDPRLYFVENELARHDLFKHIGVQLLKFSNAFRNEKQRAVNLLAEEVKVDKDVLGKVKSLLKGTESDNLEGLLHKLVYEKGFQSLIIIDELSEELADVVEDFQFVIDKIEFKAYKSRGGEFIYKFEPFLSDVEESLEETNSESLDISELDTLVVPANEDGFKKVFLGENRWWAIRMSNSMIPQIKYIAAYQTAPISAITHIATVDSIKPWKETDKYVVNFVEPAKEIKPLKLNTGGKVMAPQNIRYTSFNKLKSAKNLDEAF